MREYRKKYPDRTIKGLRKEIGKLNQNTVYIKDEGRQEAVDAVNVILSEHESGCRYDGDRVGVLINSRWVEQKL